MRFVVFAALGALVLPILPVTPAQADEPPCKQVNLTVDCLETVIGKRGSDNATGDKGRGKANVQGKQSPADPGDGSIPGCLTPFYDPDACVPTVDGKPVDIPGLARTAALEMQLPTPRPVVGPDPQRNEWNMLPVGFPLWVWTDEPKTLTASTTQQGITITMRATAAGPTRVTFGDGTIITCTTMTPRPQVINPPPPSPDCGHTYTVKGDYTITATTSWNIQWEALGFAGTITAERTGSGPLRVGELTAVLVPER